VESAGGSGGTVPTGVTHESTRAGERTGGGADERGPLDRERGGHARERSWRRQLGPTG
jgi:hypothetical protein